MRLLPLAPLALALLACTSAPARNDASTADSASDTQPPDAAPDAAPVDAAPPPDAEPVVTTVTLFDRMQFSFTGMENHRERDAMVTFPQGPFRRVSLHLELACPSNRCDPWDRAATLGLVDSSGSMPTTLEFARFITPYGVGAAWDLDLTDLQPLFTGSRTVHGLIDTWVGPGSMYGNGWLLTATLTFETGRPARVPLSVVPLGWQRAVYGDPAQPLSMQLPPRTVMAPAGATSSSLYVLTTGHGQGNAGNCAEFCQRMHSVTVDGTAHSWSVWRDDCDQNPINNQRGTWMYPRAGWCPGDLVQPHVEDLGTALAPGMAHTLSYDVEAYENTCRPMATPCRACTLGSACTYDGGNHTEPFYSVTGYVVFYGS